MSNRTWRFLGDAPTSSLREYGTFALGLLLVLLVVILCVESGAWAASWVHGWLQIPAWLLGYCAPAGGAAWVFMRLSERDWGKPRLECHGLHLGPDLVLTGVTETVDEFGHRRITLTVQSAGSPLRELFP